MENGLSCQGQTTGKHKVPEFRSTKTSFPTMSGSLRSRRIQKPGLYRICVDPNYIDRNMVSYTLHRIISFSSSPRARSMLGYQVLLARVASNHVVRRACEPCMSLAEAFVNIRHHP